MKKGNLTDREGKDKYNKHSKRKTIKPRHGVKILEANLNLTDNLITPNL